MTAKEFFSWLITSSQNPHNTSLAFKGSIAFVGGYVLQILQITCAFGVLCLVQVDQTWMTDFINGLTTLVELGFMVVGAAVTVWGLIRKATAGQWAATR